MTKYHIGKVFQVIPQEIVRYVKKTGRYEHEAAVLDWPMSSILLPVNVDSLLITVEALNRKT